VYKQFEAWREDDTWDKLPDGLRRQVRQLTRAGAIDSQSVRTGGDRGLSRLRRGQTSSWEQAAYRCRHARLAVLVQPAGMQDPVGAAPVLAEAKANAPALQLLWADARYQGPLVATAAALGLRVEVVQGVLVTTGQKSAISAKQLLVNTFSWFPSKRTYCEASCG
jgi:hypothetical protein